MPSLQQATLHCWETLTEHPQTLKEALTVLKQSAEKAERRFEEGHWPEAQSKLEETLIHTLLALKTFELDAEASFQRALFRLSHKAGQQEPPLVKVFADRVELWAEGEYRGGWTLFSNEDHKAALLMAQELGYDVSPEAEANNQLHLFP
jgi:hypothetical protein